MTEGVFFQDLAILMAVAGLVSAIFSRLKWPKVIGFIAAGIMLSSNTWGGSFLVDTTSVATIGQLGVVFLMFALGLGFSTTELNRTKNVAFPTAIIDVVVMVWLGYTVGTKIFDWGAIPSLFLGAAICDSATTMLAKVIDEMKWSGRPFVKYVMGTSLCEDILCVAVIALITGVANGKGMSLGSIGMSLGGLLIFFVAVLVFGFVLVPRLLASVAKRGDEESLLLTFLGCGFFVCYIAYRFDYSLALGAFLVGVIGSTSDVRYRLNKLIEPLKNMFAAVFFVSIGLLVDPVACSRNIPEILSIVVIVLLGKFLNCFIGALLSGESVKTAIQMGLGLAQIGEFAFLVALIYTVATGDSRTPMYQIVVAVSILTTLLNPVLLRLSEPFGEWVESKIPARINKGLEAYRALISRYRKASKEGESNQIKRAIVVLAMIGVLNFAVAIACSILASRDWAWASEFFDAHKQLFFAIVFNIFMVGTLASASRTARYLGMAIGTVITAKKEMTGWSTPLRNTVTLFTMVLVILAWFLQLTMVNLNIVPREPVAKWILAIVNVTVGVLGWRFFMKAAKRSSKRLVDAVSADERIRAARKDQPENPLVLTVPAELVHKVIIPDLSPAIGSTIAQLNIRAKTGANIIRVSRAGKLHRNPGPDWVFAPRDLVIAYGDGSQIAAMKDILGVVA